VLEQHQTWLKPTQVRELVEAYRAGATLRELSALFGLHEHTVSAHLERHGTERRVSRAKLSIADIEQASELYGSGLSWAAIGERFDVDPKTIGTWLKRAGVPMRPRKGGPPSETSGDLN
jgi:lambda repressor-like predicted transcriptional regulator